MRFDSPVVIGLEIHAELSTETKLFCSCPTQGDDIPNSRVCEVCLGMPGSKPKANKKAIDYALRLALSLGCDIAKEVVFSRKSYFYPDMAKNYQITQYEMPIGEHGCIESSGRKILIKRVHLEEDPASIIHPGGMGKSNFVLVDYNRSGNPLCEIVTEPELRSPEEARMFMKNLITLLEYLDISKPGKNIIKADANVSIKESGYVRCEIKNISGFREIERALSYEIERQRQLVSEGGMPVHETRAWEDKKGITIQLRKKETEEDYGYITDPDLVPIDITEKMLREIKGSLPELPSEKARRYVAKLKIEKEDADIIAGEYSLARLFEKAVVYVSPSIAAKWLRRELTRVLNYNKIEPSSMEIDEGQLISLLNLIEKGKITDKVGQRVIEKLVSERINVERYIAENSLESLSDSASIEKACEEAISENGKAVIDFRSGKDAAFNFIFGSAMRKTKGKADPNEIREILKKLLVKK